jgi:microcystin-dependent protein
MSVTQASLLGDTFGSSASGTVPVGGIIMWSGSTESIPTGWALCNGENGTPNLQDRFIVGAGSGYAVAATGGSADAVVVSHTHGITDPGHFHTYTRPVTNFSQRTDLDNNMFYYQEGTLNTQSNTTGITINSSGSSATNANLPPYYALAFIMRVS